MADDISRRIFAAIEARERLARAATPGPWAPDEGEDPYDDEVYTVHDGEHGDLVGEVVAFARGGDRQHANQLHIAHNNPDAVLRRCAADRRILGLHEHEEMRFAAIARITSIPAEKSPFLACIACGTRDEEGGLMFDSKFYCATVRALGDSYGVEPAVEMADE